MSGSENNDIKPIAWSNVAEHGEILDVTLDYSLAEQTADYEGNAIMGLCRVDEAEAIIDIKNHEIDKLRQQNKTLLSALKEIVKSSKKVIITDADKEAFLVLESAILAAKTAIKEGT